MSHIKKYAPRRRFEKFSNADDWEQRKLGEVTESFDGKRVPIDSGLRISGEYPYYGATGIIDYVDDYIFDGEYVLLAEDGANITMRNYPVAYLTQGKFWLNNHAHIMRMIDGSNYFLVQVLEKIDYMKYNTGTAQPKLNSKVVKNIEFKLPHVEEQRKIGTFFKQLDDTIALHQRKLEKIKALKTAYLSEMFPAEGETKPKRRFAGFTDDWEQCKLGELAEIVRGASPRPIQDPKWFDNNSEVGWLRISDVTAQDGRINYLEQRISEAGQEKTRVLKEPHLLLSIAATVGKPVINYVKTGVHDGFLIFLDIKFEQEFLFQWLEMFRTSWRKYGQPGSQVNLNSELVRNQEILIPSMKEQIKISQLFQQLDKTITIHQRKLKKLQNIKKAYLNEMFI
ncbi:restriction endonuclease subunit S [Listeria marthii]|uniref:restriction endonuclease subunit S n=1 Tax=Listeria marthii TaxID=529731 RepID=UPI0018897D8F|nr:restriction endonuclease subunit S [Listeria marthii]MBF2535827.1 restriction endonuclease subunit S [Listeria marthii]